jgi:hypothetical protein
VQASWNKQSGHANWLLNYTFSKALGIRGENGTSGVGDATNINNDYGRIAQRQNSLVQRGLRLPGRLHLSTAIRSWAGAVNGWQLSGITQFQSGSPLQAVNASNFGLGGSTTQPYTLTEWRGGSDRHGYYESVDNRLAQHEANSRFSPATRERACRRISSSTELLCCADSWQQWLVYHALH